MFGQSIFGLAVFGQIDLTIYTGPTWQVICPNEVNWVDIPSDTNDKRECRDGS